MDQFNLNENIIARLGIENMPEDQRVKILENAVELIQKRIILKLMENLPAADVERANDLADRPEELIAFLASKTEDFGALIDAEVVAVKNELVLNAAVPETEQ